MNQAFYEKVAKIKEPMFKGSYEENDCVFLLRDISHLVSETDTEEKESNLSKGIHYSEMLPKEHFPTEEYVQLFHESLKESAEQVATYVAYLSDLIVQEKGLDVVLVSLARAGTPIGVLIKRYIEQQYGISLPHYTISIIRGKGFDENAVAYIINKEQTTNLQFIDGWTGKGAINTVLKQSTIEFKQKFDVEIDPELAVLADPSKATTMFGTREDYLIPSACLNSTVSGLASRTFHDSSIIGEHEFHGAKYYQEWEETDLSQFFIDEISKHFFTTHETKEKKKLEKGMVENTGMKEVLRIQEMFDINDINKVKPGVGETTRVLLRRVPWKILVNDLDNPYLKHILLLANERKVPVEVFTDMNYSCIGLIKENHHDI